MKSKSRFWQKSPKAEAPTAPPRTKEEIQAEYDDLAKQAGDVQFKIVSLKALLQHVNMRMGQVIDELVKVAPEAAGANPAPTPEPTPAPEPEPAPQTDAPN